MPKLTGLLGFFPELYDVSVEGVAFWLKSRLSPKLIESRLGNKALYPQTIPETPEESLFELAVLKEALRLHPQDYYNQNLHKIFIPEGLLERFPDLQKLGIAFIDAIRPKKDITGMYLQSNTLGLKSLGAYIRPEITGGSGKVCLWVDGRRMDIEVDCKIVVPAEGGRVDVRFQSQSAKLLGKNDIATEVPGGQLGLIINTYRGEQ